ncbi:MAG: glycoprotein [Artemisia capillaris nucleorhabdovirus 1]|uniref:Glycoprotein n=1 Tax=Artemisia capillaris nucleorhabdovirus 1 TaxID=2912606 RepID=A0AAX2ZPF4_9RHAB|nr:MAG: glycoprotein [Artemisia capillaris nucleorhabdovirus 1]UKL15220.1 MAG: glycoprotein [Artemisia capillaris nucleorhabdovirus 1]
MSYARVLVSLTTLIILTQVFLLLEEACSEISYWEKDGKWYAQWVPSPATSVEVPAPSPERIPAPPSPTLDKLPAVHQTTYGTIHVGVPTDTDLYPIYYCPNVSIYDLLPVWYSGCLSMCSITSVQDLVDISVFQINSTLGSTDLYKVSVRSVTKYSHVSVFGSCTVSVTADDYVSPPSDKLSEWVTKLSIDRPSGSQEWDYSSDPPCNYFSDEYSTGYKLYVTHYKVEISVDSAQNRYLRDPTNGLYMSYEQDYYVDGSTFYHWVQNSDVSQEVCYFREIGEDSCTVDSSSGYISCRVLGITFKKDIKNIITSSCAGSLNVSSDGVIYQVLSAYNKTSLSDRLSGLLSSNINMNQLIHVINDALISIEDAYCSSTCDVMEIILSNYPTATTVIETPIGPWLPLVAKGNTVMTACSADTEWYLKLPIEYCAEKNMMKVVHNSTKSEEWWRIMNTYVVSGESCNSSDSGWDEILVEKMQSKREIVFHFWRGDLTLVYPYNVSHWTLYKDEKIQRSSKWFPKLQYMMLDKEIYIDNVTQALHNYTQDIYNHYMGNQTASTGLGSIIPRILDRITLSVGNAVKLVVKISGEVILFIMSHIHLIGDIIITVVCMVIGYYLIYIPTRWVRKRRGDTSARITAVSNSYEMVPSSRTTRKDIL